VAARLRPSSSAFATQSIFSSSFDEATHVLALSEIFHEQFSVISRLHFLAVVFSCHGGATSVVQAYEKHEGLFSNFSNEEGRSS
jgi:hypothetical protein